MSVGDCSGELDICELDALGPRLDGEEYSESNEGLRE